MLAEAVSLDGKAIFLLLMALLIFLAFCIAVVVLGCVWAVRAGRGSRRALVGLVVCIIPEALLLLPAAGQLISGNGSPFAVLPAAALAAQGLLYQQARSSRRELPPAPAAGPGTAQAESDSAGEADGVAPS